MSTSRAIYSCLTCRRRKVRCDRRHPECTACLRGGHHCGYTVPELKRARRASGIDADVDQRLRRLEALVTQALASQEQNTTAQERGDEQLPKLPSSEGTLLVEDGKSRFVNDLYWALLADEEDQIGEEHSGSPESVFGASDEKNGFERLMYGPFLSRSQDVRHCYPNREEHCTYLFNAFKTNVDVMIRVVHMPTLERRFLDFVASSSVYTGVWTDESNVRSGFEPLFFAILYSAVLSLQEDEGLTECIELDYATALSLFREGLEQALRRERFMTGATIETLQALVIFMSSGCDESAMETTWCLVGLGIRMALTLGLHRDPTIFKKHKMDCVEVEVRRRVWHQLGLLEMRAAEALGHGFCITDHRFDTLLPRNVNDEDLIPGDPPKHHDEDPPNVTQTTTQAIRWLGVHALRALHQVALSDSIKLAPLALGDVHFAASCWAATPSAMDLADQMRAVISEFERKVESHFGTLLAAADDPLNVEQVLSMAKVTEVTQLLDVCGFPAFGGYLVRLFTNKLWLSFYRRFSPRLDPADITPEARCSLLEGSVWSTEMLYRAISMPEGARFRWYSNTHSALSAVSHILYELARTDIPEETFPRELRERAWRAAAALRGAKSLEVRRKKAWRLMDRMFLKIEAKRRAHEQPREQQSEGNEVDIDMNQGLWGFGDSETDSCFDDFLTDGVYDDTICQLDIGLAL